jgi:hypothetical protein
MNTNKHTINELVISLHNLIKTKTLHYTQSKCIAKTIALLNQGKTSNDPVYLHALQATGNNILIRYSM